MRYREIVAERQAVSSVDVIRADGTPTLRVQPADGASIDILGPTGDLHRRMQAILTGADPDFEMADYPRTIRWIIPRWSKGDIESGNSRLVWIDPARMDRDFQKTDFHVGHGGEGGVGRRYQQFDGWVRQDKPVEASEVYFDVRGDLSFENGRHRFAWMRDHGARAVPIVVPANQAGDFVSRYGADQRTTTLD